MFYTLANMWATAGAIAIVILWGLFLLVVVLYVFSVVLAMLADVVGSIFAPLQAILWKWWDRITGRNP
jgi:hypothetical protein